MGDICQNSGRGVALRPSVWDDCQLELDQLLSDPNFQCSDRNKRFLQYVSNELFEGREAIVKAYTIAVDVFGRPPSFDPAIDPIVRIEATRLRAALIQYYEVHGSDRIQIELPKGRYIPNFIRPSPQRLIGPEPAIVLGSSAAHAHPNKVCKLQERIGQLEQLIGQKAAEIEILREVLDLVREIEQGDPRAR